MRRGVVTRVIPDVQSQDWLNEYEVDFGGQLIAIVHETFVNWDAWGPALTTPVTAVPSHFRSTVTGLR
jgi:hypothetical protein